MRVIRHSDDLGITEQATKQLLASWLAGNLDGFSILANGDAVALVSEALLNNPQPARIAVHFNLTEGYPLAPSYEIDLLVDARGRFKHNFVSLLMVLLGSTPKKREKLKEQIRLECTKQIEFIRSLCGTRSITAIDGHVHIHMIPGVFDTVARCAHDEGIPEIRISNEPFHLADTRKDWKQRFWWINLSKHLLLRLFSLAAHSKVRARGLYAPDAILGVLYSGEMSLERTLSGLRAAKAAAASELEIIFHIGRSTPKEVSQWKNNQEAEFHLSKWRDIERDELSSFTDIMYQIL